jgi:hypothetical protein
MKFSMRKILIILLFFGIVSAQNDRYEYHSIMPTSAMLIPSLNLYATFGWDLVQETRLKVVVKGQGTIQAHQVILIRLYSEYNRRILRDNHIRELATMVEANIDWIKDIPGYSTKEDKLAEYLANHFGIIYNPEFKDMPHWSDPNRQIKELNAQIKELKESNQ